MGTTKKLNRTSVDVESLCSKFLPGRKKKYANLLFGLIKNRLSEYVESKFNSEGDIEIISHATGLDFEAVKKEFNDFEIVFFLRTVLSIMDADLIDKVAEFADLNERGLIKNPDITTYKTVDDLRSEIYLASLTSSSKYLSDLVIKDHECDEWLVVRPITLHASRKYGSGTKWCTTMTDNDIHFNRYAGTGILIYCINKKTGYRAAAYKDLTGPEVSFWDDEDNRMDSYLMKTPAHIKEVIFKIFDGETKNNTQYMTEKDVERVRELREMEKKKVKAVRTDLDVARTMQEMSERMGHGVLTGMTIGIDVEVPGPNLTEVAFNEEANRVAREMGIDDDMELPFDENGDPQPEDSALRSADGDEEVGETTLTDARGRLALQYVEGLPNLAGTFDITNRELIEHLQDEISRQILDYLSTNR